MKFLIFLLMLTMALSSCNAENNNAPAETAPESDITESETFSAGIESDETLGETEVDTVMREVESYNYIIGTQAFSPNYRFTDEEPLVELGSRITELGSNAIKFHATDDGTVDELLSRYDFKYVFMWYRSDPYFRDGYTDEEAKADYDAIYAYTKKLLTEYNGSGIEFYIGHWEGDWYYLDNYNTAQQTVSSTITEGMIAWLNNRQKAVDDAKADTPHENVEVWNYLELNRPTDILSGDCDRVINRVLPYTNVDYVSYSAYDVMDSHEKQVKRVIDKIYENLPEKDGVPSPRVFIGEFGQPAANQGFDGEQHRDVNLKNMAKFLSCNVKFVLYWQMYDNEKLEDGSCRGFWLINDKNEKQPLYYSLESVLAQAKEYVKGFLKDYGRVPTNEEYRSFLLTLPEFGG